MKNSFWGKNKKIIIIVLVLIVVVTLAFLFFSNKNNGKSTSATIETIQKVTRGNIKVEISGSGVIEPIGRYDITPLVNGNIISAPFEEGQQIKKGDILYKLDATELEGNIQKTKNSISKLELNDLSTQDSMNKSVIYAGVSGRLTNFIVKENDTVASNKLGDIIDDNNRIASVPFNKGQVSQIHIGESATVICEAYMSSIEGKVTKIKNFSTSGSTLQDVEITIPEASNIAKDTQVTAKIGNLESPGIGKIDLPETYSVVSTLSGRVTKVFASNDDEVTKGQKLFELETDPYVNTLKRSSLDRSDAQLTLEAQQKQLEDYNIISPINGVVLKKNNKVGDTINSIQTSLSLMVVADMSKVKFDMKIDELDIAKIKMGQPVKVVADALPNSI